MTGAEANSFLHQVAEQFQAFRFDGRMTATAGREHEDRRGTIEHVRVRWPVIGDNQDVDAGHAGQAFLQQQATGAVFVFQVAVAWRAGKENNLFFGSVSVEVQECDYCRCSKNDSAHRFFTFSFTPALFPRRGRSFSSAGQSSLATDFSSGLTRVSLSWGRESG